MMSHILHFYHLAALDYVNPNVLLGGVPTKLKRPFLCPRYHDNYYITTQRILAIAGLGILPPLAVTALSGLPGWGPPTNDPGGAVNAYLVGQYLKALDIRRICHEMQAIFSGRAPQCSGWTAGGATASVDKASINKYQALLNQVKAFVGEPTDFKNGIAGTYMFDVVAAAHLFPEYFWIGNSYGHFMANGWGEAAGNIPLSGALGAVFGSINNLDQRALCRGYKLSALAGAPLNTLNILRIGESVAYSKYNPYPVGGLPEQNFRHPWNGVTKPDPLGTGNPNGYSWLKAPRYKENVSNQWTVFEVGPLARQVVNGTYWAGILTVPALYPLLAPVLFAGAPGPDCSSGGAGWGQALQPVYAAIPGVTGGPWLSGAPYTGDSVLDRIAARAIETRIMVDVAQEVLTDLENERKTHDSSPGANDGYGASGCTDRFGENVPVSSTTYRGYGMSEASRGALSHWIAVQNGRTTLYQAVVPTTWNASPRDVNNNPGPTEQSLLSNGGLWVANPAEPIEVVRVTHSYDFCIACAVHLVTPKGDVVKVDVPALPG
jgi:hydrogenase large subunit